MSDDIDPPPPAVSVSPDDQSSDRKQSDEDHAESAAANVDDRSVADKADAVAVESNRDDRAVADAADEVAVTEREGLRAQAAANRDEMDKRFDQLRIDGDDIRDLARSSKAQADSNNALALAMVEYQERAVTARRRFRATISTIVGAVTIVLAGLLIAVLVLAIKLNKALDSAASSRAQLADCILATGHCKKQGDAATGRAISSINDATIAAVYCDRVVPQSASLATFRLCVLSKLPTK